MSSEDQIKKQEEQESKNTLANGCELSKETFDDFVSRLNFDIKHNNLCTADPVFDVQVWRTEWCVDKEFTDDVGVVCDDSVWFSLDEWYEDERCESGNGSLAYSDRKWYDLDAYEKEIVVESIEDHRVLGYKREWAHVNSHLTKDAAERFISRKKHDYGKMRVFVSSAYWCWELKEIMEGLRDGRIVYAERE